MCHVTTPEKGTYRSGEKNAEKHGRKNEKTKKKMNERNGCERERKEKRIWKRKVGRNKWQGTKEVLENENEET